MLLTDTRTIFPFPWRVAPSCTESASLYADVYFYQNTVEYWIYQVFISFDWLMLAQSQNQSLVLIDLTIFPISQLWDLSIFFRLVNLITGLRCCYGESLRLFMPSHLSDRSILESWLLVMIWILQWLFPELSLFVCSPYESSYSLFSSTIVCYW